MNRIKVLTTAANLTAGDRNDSYGTPWDNHQRIAAIWSVILGIEVTATQAALCMAGMKLARLAYDPTHTDSCVDGAAYFAIASECASTDYSQEEPI